MAFWLIGPPGTAHPSPIYELMRLFSMTVSPGARVVDFAADSERSVVVGFAGPNERLTVLGLDTRGGLPSAPAGESSYSFANLPPNTEFQVRYWNRGGQGRTVTHSRKRSDGSGALTVTAPLRSVFALTSLPPQ